MTDSRTLAEIIAAHPVPWLPRTMPVLLNRQALIQVRDHAGAEVPLFTMLRVVQLVTDRFAANQKAAVPTQEQPT